MFTRGILAPAILAPELRSEDENTKKKNTKTQKSSSLRGEDDFCWSEDEPVYSIVLSR